MNPYCGAAGVIGPGLTGAGTLAATGLQALAWIVAVTTLFFAALALVKLVPRRRPRLAPQPEGLQIPASPATTSPMHRPRQTPLHRQFDQLFRDDH